MTDVYVFWGDFVKFTENYTTSVMTWNGESVIFLSRKTIGEIPCEREMQ